MRVRVTDLRSALESMCYQFAHWADGKGLWTGGLSALEEAFEALGWDDPHYVAEQFCDEPGCGKQNTCGWNSDSGYRRTCFEHSRFAKESV